MRQKNLFKICILLFLTLFHGCNENDLIPEKKSNETNISYENNSEGQIILGKKLDDPYSFANMKKAYASLMAKGVKVDTINLSPTHLYLRFLPKNEEEWAILKRDSTIALFDYPLNYEIATNGTYYHDPELPDTVITWQYTVIPLNHPIPNILHEKLYEVYIPPMVEEDSSQKGSLDEFYALLEYESMKLTGNLTEPTVQSGVKDLWPDKWQPKGTLKVNDDYLGEIPLVGAKVHVRFLTHVETAITDSKGYFEASKFRYKAHYSIKWERADFDIRSGNWGQAWYHRDGRHNDDWNLTIKKGGISWCYAHIHRAAYEYYYLNYKYGIRKPPSQGGFLNQNLHIGAMDREGRSHYYDFKKYILAAQVTIFCKYAGSWQSSIELFATTIHELAHASHWNMGYSTSQYLIDYIFRRALIPESWASCVEHVITTEVYKSAQIIYHHNWYYNSWGNKQDETFAEFDGYTPLFIDLIDDYNQRQVEKDKNNPGYMSYPIDRVYGYTLAQLEDVLDATYVDLGLMGTGTEQLIESFGLSIYKNKLRNSFSNPSSGYINELFSNYY